MNGGLMFGAICLSLLGLGYLAATDAKRRRIFRQAKLTKRMLAWPARIAAFGPGIYLTLIGHWSGLAIWAGAVTTIGWAMVAIPPNVYRTARTRIAAAFDQSTLKARPFVSGATRSLIVVKILVAGFLTNLGARFSPALPGTSSSASAIDQVAHLETRIAELESRLAALEESSVSDKAVDSTVDPLIPRSNERQSETTQKLDAAE